MDNQKIAKELIGLARDLTAADELPSDRELRKFLDYVMDFYGRSGVYPITKNGRPLNKRDATKATWKLLKGRHEWGGGDTIDREAVRDVLLDEGYDWPGEEKKVASESRRLMSVDMENATLEELDANASQFTRDVESAGWDEKGIGFYFNRDYPTIFLDLNGIQGQVYSNVDEHELEYEFVDDYKGLMKWLKSADYKKHLRAIKTVNDWKKLESKGWKRVVDKQSDFYVNPKYPEIALWDVATSLGHISIVQVEQGRGLSWNVSKPLAKVKTVGQAAAMAKKIAEDIKEDDEPYVEIFRVVVKELDREFGRYENVYIGGKIYKIPRGIEFNMNNYGDLSTSKGKSELKVAIWKPKRGPWVASMKGYSGGLGDDYKTVSLKAKGREEVPFPRDVVRVISRMADKAGFIQ